eukprot:tig00021168_g19110.t1
MQQDSAWWSSGGPFDGPLAFESSQQYTSSSLPPSSTFHNAQFPNSSPTYTYNSYDVYRTSSFDQQSLASTAGASVPPSSVPQLPQQQFWSYQSQPQFSAPYTDSATTLSQASHSQQDFAAYQSLQPIDHSQLSDAGASGQIPDSFEDARSVAAYRGERFQPMRMQEQTYQPAGTSFQGTSATQRQDGGVFGYEQSDMQYGLAYPLPSLASARADPYSSADSSRSSFAFGGRGDSPSLLQHQQTQQQQQQQQQLQRSPVLPSGVPLTHSLASTGMSSHMMHALPPPLPSPPPPPPPQQQQLPPTSSASFVPLPAPLAQQQRQQPLTQASISSQSRLLHSLSSFTSNLPPSTQNLPRPPALPLPSEPPAQQKPGAAPVRADTQQQGYKHAAHAGYGSGRRGATSAEDPAAAAPKSAATLQGAFHAAASQTQASPASSRAPYPPTSWDAFAAYPISEIPPGYTYASAPTSFSTSAEPLRADATAYPAPQTQFQAYSRPTGAPAPPLPGASQVKVEAARAGGRAGEAAPPPRQRGRPRAPEARADLHAPRGGAPPRASASGRGRSRWQRRPRRRSRPYPPYPPTSHPASPSPSSPSPRTPPPPPPSPPKLRGPTGRGLPRAPRIGHRRPRRPRAARRRPGGPAAAAGTQLPPGAGPARTPATTRGGTSGGARGAGPAGAAPARGAQPLAPPLPALALKVPSAAAAPPRLCLPFRVVPPAPMKVDLPLADPEEAPRSPTGSDPPSPRDDFPFAYGPSEAAPVAYEPIPKTELVDNSWRPPPPPRPLHT